MRGYVLVDKGISRDGMHELVLWISESPYDPDYKFTSSRDGTYRFWVGEASGWFIPHYEKEFLEGTSALELVEREGGTFTDKWMEATRGT